MLVNPELVVGLVHLEMGDVEVWVTVATARRQVVGHELCVLVEVVPLSLISLPCLEALQLILDLFAGLVELVGPGGRGAPQLLFVGDEVEVGVLL